MIRHRSRYRVGVGMATLLTAAVLAGRCGKSSTQPTPPPSPPVDVTLAVPVLKAPIAGAETAGLRPSLEVTNAVTTGAVGTVTYRFEISELTSFPADSRTATFDNVPQGAGTTAAQLVSDLEPARLYYWRARATNGTITTAFSPVETLRAANIGVRNGLRIYDPLTNGATIADERWGGQFVTGANGGWQANTRSDSLDYNIPGCTNCKVEFDATNFDRSTLPEDIDMKWFSMGDGSTFNDFNAFRDHIWKMHIEKRSGDGGAIKLIWRRGCNDSDSCDNTDNLKIPIAWNPSTVYRFTIQWGGGSMSVSVCALGADGCAATVYTASASGPYAPPNHRVQLGTRIRTETLVGARFRNVRIGPS